MARRASARSRKAGPQAATTPAVGSAEASDPAESAPRPEDLAAGLRRLGGCAVGLLGFLAVAWLWELDLAFVRFLLNQPLWFVDDQTPVTVGDLGEAGAIVLAGVLAWRYMSTVFALTLFHRMPDDPGVRFAVVMLCRYAVLAIASIAALGAIRLDMARIGVVLAALGVGLGFGLQEIISNFVCGIILLLERPIRIGDIVTVADTTGRVDRIHIRATTIVNGDNQSMIVPNRQFITGNLVNWTHNDKILRVGIKLGVAYGTDPRTGGGPADVGGAAGSGRPDEPGAIGDDGGVRRVRVCSSRSTRSSPSRRWWGRCGTGSARRSSGGSRRRGS